MFGRSTRPTTIRKGAPTAGYGTIHVFGRGMGYMAQRSSGRWIDAVKGSAIRSICERTVNEGLRGPVQCFGYFGICGYVRNLITLPLLSECGVPLNGHNANWGNSSTCAAIHMLTKQMKA